MAIYFDIIDLVKNYMVVNELKSPYEKVHIFQLKKSITYIWCIYVVIFLNKCLFLQVENLSLATNLENYCFYAMLIACKCMPLCKKLVCDTKSGPPYLATIKRINLLWRFDDFVVKLIEVFNEPITYDEAFQVPSQCEAIERDINVIHKNKI